MRLLKWFFKGIYIKSEEYTVAYGITLLLYLSIVFFADKSPGVSFLEALKNAGYLWIVFGFIFATSGMMALVKLVIGTKKKENKSS